MYIVESAVAVIQGLTGLAGIVPLISTDYIHVDYNQRNMVRIKPTPMWHKFSIFNTEHTYN